MAYACPHCTKEIAGVVSQDTLTERLAVKQSAIDNLTAEKATLQARVEQATKGAGDAAALQGQIDTLTKQLDTARREQGEYIAAASAGVTDPKKLKFIRLAYEDAHEGVEEAKRPAFEAWLADASGARAHDAVRHLFAAPGQPPAAGAHMQPPRKDAPPPVTPPATGRPSPAQISAYFASPEFKSLPREQQRAKMAELEAQVKAAPGQDGRA